jgi:predicted O-methyltransferase YrrM
MERCELRYQDRLLPDQPEQSKLFSGAQGTFLDQLYNTIVTASAIASPHEELKLELSERFRIEEMSSSPVNLRLLQVLMAMIGAKYVLEIGAFIGVSAIYMARALPQGGQVVTIEKYEPFWELCRKNFELNGVADRIRLLRGDAHELVASLPLDKPFDFVLLDGNKERYADYFGMIDPLVRPGGMIVVDDVFFHGDALNASPSTEKGRGVREFLNIASGRDDYMKIVLPISNGVMLMWKQTG